MADQTGMTSTADIADLVDRFNRNIDAYRQGKYNETLVRREFIDPMFAALGWDIDNQAGYAEAYKDVIHEDAIKIGGSTKAPDYCFRIGGTRKFFVEAKKPSVNIAQDISPAYQLRRYGWSAKLPLSILTDFEEFAVYDCRIRPKQGDKASTARTKYFTFDNYVEQWDEISAIFAKESVLQGSFDKYATGHKKRGTAEVDAEFLKEIEKWRAALARNIARKNPALGVREINFAVQRTIDRIIFLRMCEDRGAEQYGGFQPLMNGIDVYGRLMQMFRAADDRYNSGLFHFNDERGRDHSPDTLTPQLKIDDKVLKEIFKGLYYPDSPYEFSVLPADILGNVYEQFLGSVIHLTPSHQAKVEEKPEVKKAGGVYYTPKYIVRYIVEHTIGKLIEGKTPQQIGGLTDTYRTSKNGKPLRFLDPACGSGSFLVGAYKFLLEKHRDWYLADGAEKHTKRLYQGRNAQWYLTTAEKKRILLSNIYGVDIDSQAVEVTKLNLLLCVMENENQSTIGQMELIHERILPDLSNNIKCGNSLIGSDFYQGQQLDLFDTEAQIKINAFDWETEFPQIFKGKKPGFDAVIGNPPYGALLMHEETDYLDRKYQLVQYQRDTYVYFVEKGLHLLRDKAILGLIIPNTWLLNLSYDKIRKHIFSQTKVQTIVHYRHPVFAKATVDTEIVTLQKTSPGELDGIRITIISKAGTHTCYSIPQCRWKDRVGKPVNIFERPEFIGLGDRIRKLPILDNLCRITQGSKPFQVGKGKPKQTRKTVDEKPFVATQQTDSTFRPLLRGSLMHQYTISWNRDYWIKFGDWLAEPRYSAHHEDPEKIVIRQTGDSLVATLDRQQFIVRDNLYTIVSNSSIRLPYVLGLLNSKLLNWFYQNIINPESGEALAQVKRAHIAQLPMAAQANGEPLDKSRHDQMVELVERMLRLQKSLPTAKTDHEKTLLQRQIKTTDNQIDKLVYELYGLSDDEIAIVEGAG